MCFALAQAKIPDITIKDPQCVSKTYPDFWKDFARVTSQ
jgi:5-enolpyruvylshikimate-3-phosphate synthase